MKRKVLAISLVLILAVTLAFATTTGPRLPTTATGNTNTIGAGTVAWINPTNIELSDGVFSTCIPGTATTDDLRGGGFGFTIPLTDTINGIQLDVSGKATTGGIEAFFTVELEGGGGTSANRASGALGTTLTTFSFGGPADLWGTTWTPTQINAAGFVGNVSFKTTAGGPGTVSVDFMQITVTSTPAATPASGFFKMFGFNTRPPLPHTQTRTFGYDDRKR